MPSSSELKELLQRVYREALRFSERKQLSTCRLCGSELDYGEHPGRLHRDGCVMLDVYDAFTALGAELPPDPPASGLVVPPPPQEPK